MEEFVTNIGSNLVLQSNNSEIKTLVIDFPNNVQNKNFNNDNQKTGNRQEFYILNKVSNQKNLKSFPQQEDNCSESEDDEDYCKKCGEIVDVILAHIAENGKCLQWYQKQKCQKIPVSSDTTKTIVNKKAVMTDSALVEMEKNLEGIIARLDKCEKIMNSKSNKIIVWKNPISVGEKESPEYFDNDTMVQIRVDNIRPATQKVCLRKNTEAPRKNYIKKEKCKHCNISCKYILSHLTKSFRCQVDYDMTKLRQIAMDNKRIRQRFYERSNICSSIRSTKRAQHCFLDTNRKDTKNTLSVSNDFIYKKKLETTYRKKQKARLLQLELQQYHKELSEKNQAEDLRCDEVINLTQNILQSTINEDTVFFRALKPIPSKLKQELAVAKFKPIKKVIKLTNTAEGTEGSGIEVVEASPCDDEISTLHIEFEEEK